MTDAPPTTTLAERALTRLRKIASGNGLEPASIALIDVQESDFTLAGTMEVSPLSETEPTTYPGGVRGTDRRMSSSFAALAQAVTAFQKEFRESPDWLDGVVRELKIHDSQGWGLENAKVTLPEHSAILAATETCPSCQGRKMLTCGQCHGQGTVICTQCQGQGREPCYHCGGRGENPHQPGQPCPTCNGTRTAPCRFCQSRGQLACPTCQGKRGTICTACQGNGKITQEVTVTCGAETHFKLIAKDLPSGLRRGLERVGVANLGKGHADIASSPVPEDEDGPRDKPPFPVLNYQVTLPYAEMRMTFGAKKAVISTFGKRGVIIGAPHFLDDALKPWREKLRQAAFGKTPLNEALGARAIKEMLGLAVAGKDTLDEVRKLYPFGLSNDAIKSILADIILALNRMTLKARSFIAGLCAILCAALFYVLFDMEYLARWTMGWNVGAGFATSLAVVGTGLGASWAALNFATRFMLRKNFPQMRLSLQQKIGKTGLMMLATIVVLSMLCLWFAPVRMMWMTRLFYLFITLSH